MANVFKEVNFWFDESDSKLIQKVACKSKLETNDIQHLVTLCGDLNYAIENDSKSIITDTDKKLHIVRLRKESNG
jgi:hypothetical protein|tara:strand:- start:65 stop:289 length:225 start_codon:yes stop_codon:yes gene_type:complete